MGYRNKYRWGAKAFLANMEIGETREDDGAFCWRTLQVIACRMREDYGCHFRFRTKWGIRKVTRLA